MSDSDAVRVVDVPTQSLEDWQSIVDTTARVIGVPAGLIMRLNDPDIEVYVASRTNGNPYHVGDREHFEDSGLYCETVIKTNDRLLVPDALADEHWKNNPDVALDMISYLGYPIIFPDGRLFGTICVLDEKRNEYGEEYLSFLEKMRDLVQAQLALVYMPLITNPAIPSSDGA